MEDSRMLKYKMGYERMLKALGRYCDEQHLDEVCLLEFENGIVLQGLRVESTGEGYVRGSVTRTLSFEEIAALVK